MRLCVLSYAEKHPLLLHLHLHQIKYQLCDFSFFLYQIFQKIKQQIQNIVKPKSSLKSKSQIQVPNPKSKVQRRGTGTGADTIILQATQAPGVTVILSSDLFPCQVVTSGVTLILSSDLSPCQVVTHGVTVILSSDLSPCQVVTHGVTVILSSDLFPCQVVTPGVTVILCLDLSPRLRASDHPHCSD